MLSWSPYLFQSSHPYSTSNIFSVFKFGVFFALQIYLRFEIFYRLNSSGTKGITAESLALRRTLVGYF